MILMLNCSYKAKGSNTEYFFSILKSEIEQISDRDYKVVNLRDVFKGQNFENEAIDGFVSDLKNAKALVIGAPLYVDGLPAQAIKLMEILLANYKGEIPKLPVYVISNLGFYEAEQIKHLLAIVENWCKRMGFLYGGGLALGAGPLIRALERMPLKKGVLKAAGLGFEKLAYAVVNRKRMKNYYVKTMIPRIVYMKAAHINFDKTAKGNGLKVSEVR